MAAGTGVAVWRRCAVDLVEVLPFLELPRQVDAAAFVGLLFGLNLDDFGLFHPPIYRCSCQFLCIRISIEPKKREYG